jgi:hypothetical protein
LPLAISLIFAGLGPVFEGFRLVQNQGVVHSFVAIMAFRAIERIERGGY